jgi:hypothetical protein
MAGAGWRVGGDALKEGTAAESASGTWAGTDGDVSGLTLVIGPKDGAKDDGNTKAKSADSPTAACGLGGLAGGDALKEGTAVVESASGM